MECLAESGGGGSYHGNTGRKACLRCGGHAAQCCSVATAGSDPAQPRTQRHYGEISGTFPANE